MRTLMRQPFEDRPHRPCPETARQGYAWRKAPPSFARTRKIRCRRNRATAISENPGMDFRRYYARHSPETPGSGQKGKGPPRHPSQGARTNIPHPGKKRCPRENRYHRLRIFSRGTFQQSVRPYLCPLPRHTAVRESVREGRPGTRLHPEAPGRTPPWSGGSREDICVSSAIQGNRSV